MGAWLSSMGWLRERVWAGLLDSSRRGVVRAREAIVKTAVDARRSIKRWSVRSWREIDMAPLESEERIGRARARWDGARWKEGKSAHEWTKEYLEAVRAGLSDPCALAPKQKIGLREAMSLGAAAIGSRLLEEPELERIADDGRQSFCKDWKVCAQQGKRGGRAAQRARWILLCSQSLQKALKAFECPRHTDWKIKTVMGVLELCLFPVALLCCWLIASWKAWSAGSWGRRNSEWSDENAKRTVEEALDWLGDFEQCKGNGDEVWVWEWAGVSARDFERLESAAWLGNAAAARLPAVERAMCAANWMEAMGGLLSKPEGYVFESSSRHSPSGEFWMLARGSNPRGAGVSDTLRSGLESKGAYIFFGGNSRRLGLNVEASWLMALAAHAYGIEESKAMAGLVQNSEGAFAVAVAWSALRGGRLAEIGQVGLGLALARNPRVSYSEGADGITDSAPAKRAFEAEREALIIHAELEGVVSSPVMEDELPVARPVRRL